MHLTHPSDAVRGWVCIIFKGILMSHFPSSPKEDVPAWANGLSRVIVWLVIVAGISWLVWLAWGCIELSLGLVPSSDIGMTYFLPFAALAVVVGLRVDRFVQRSRRR
jgi:hypothetical protein